MMTKAVLPFQHIAIEGVPKSQKTQLALVLTSLLGRLLIYDGADLSSEIISIERNPACPVCSQA